LRESVDLLDLKSLKVFLTVADLASMTAAGRRLGLSQSAVSQAIRQLEESIGAVLIARERRPLALTAAGIALRQRGATLVSEAETLYRTVREQAGAQAQLLRLGMVDSFAATVGPSLVKHLLSSAVQIHVASGLGPELAAALRERRLDMIVTTSFPETTNALERHPLLSEKYVLLVPRSTMNGEMWAPLALRAFPPSGSEPSLGRPGGRQIREHDAPTLASLSKWLPLVRFNGDSHIGAQIENYLRERDVVPPRRLEIDTAETLVAMVAGGVGWALITPLCLLQARANVETVLPLPLPDPGFRRELTLVSRPGEYGDLPRSIAKIGGEIFRTEWQPRLAWLAPWLVNAVTVV
jgi:DNA-binding transcriptional LysR family regulator